MGCTFGRQKGSTIIHGFQKILDEPNRRSDDKVNKYKSSTYINSNVEKMINILNLKLVTMYEHQNIKTFLQKVTHQIDLKKFSWSKKLKILTNNKNISEFRVEKQSRRKVINYISNGKAMIISLIAAFIKKIVI